MKPILQEGMVCCEVLVIAEAFEYPLYCNGTLG
jgi:hypothetical protein